MLRQILVVDDSPALVEMIVDHFEEQGYQVDSAGRGSEALKKLSRGFEGIVLLDFKLPDVDGLELLDSISVTSPNCRTIMITAHGSIGMAVEAVQNRGAFYVHSKSEDSFLERLTGTVGNAFTQLELVRKLESLESHLGSRYSFASIITQSRLMQTIFRQLDNVIDSKVTVLVQGESGTGKELIARAIHYNGPRKQEAFVAINCAGIPDTLLESELFGYEKGAFTGAYGRKTGKFEQANKGTVFLDEIGEMNLALQAKILRVLQEKSFERLGGNDTVHVDVRIVSATNKDLEAAVHNGSFREDLYYRLAVFPIDLPPLRERREDIPILAGHFLQRFRKEEGKAVDGFTQRVMDRLVGFNYPGNVRQLENIISHAVVVVSGSKVDLPDLPAYLRKWEQPGTNPASERGYGEDEANPGLGFAKLPGGPGVPPVSAAMGGAGRPIITLKQLEIIAIKQAVEACNGNVSRAARMLDISRATIYRKLRELEEEQPQLPGART